MILADLRKKMQLLGVEAYLVSHGNCFIGQEDILPQEHKLHKICGFSGSAGALLITAQKAYLFVDGRYELQALKETDATEITVVNRLPTLNEICRFAEEINVRRIGYDEWCYSVAEIAETGAKYPQTETVKVGNLLDEQPQPVVEAMERKEEFSGCSATEKCRIFAKFIQDNGADYMLITSADCVSWLLNLYARDLPYSPIVRAYALLDCKGKVRLFGNLKAENFEVKPLAEITTYLQNSGKVKVLYNAASMPQALKNIPVIWQETSDVITIAKAVKNAVELQGMINCHIRDGVAVVKFLSWLENNRQGKTELDVVAKLHELRAAQKMFFSESFGTIAAAAENAAIVHYQPSASSNARLKENNLLLLDSGGQYYDGTTDITRTVAIGEPTAEMKRDFTVVLQAHIALATAKFPYGTTGERLDVLARHKLWNYGLDYKHGTGHGVACFGNVHEGPVYIANRSSAYGFRENMVTSVEPGYYKAESYGIRIENLVYTVKSADTGFLEFRYLTKVPIDKRLIDKYMLSRGERAWLNNYHKDVYESLVAYLNEDEIYWLKKACSPL